MAFITTSYFAISRYFEGTKISIARHNNPKFVGKLDEIQTLFAPSAELLKDYKHGRIDWREYTKRYTREQRQHFREKPEDFRGLLDRASVEDIALLCYEKYVGRDTKCHRFLLYEMLKKVAEKEDYDVNFLDETFRVK